MVGGSGGVSDDLQSACVESLLVIKCIYQLNNIVSPRSIFCGKRVWLKGIIKVCARVSTGIFIEPLARELFLKCF